LQSFRRFGGFPEAACHDAQFIAEHFIIIGRTVITVATCRNGDEIARSRRRKQIFRRHMIARRRWPVTIGALLLGHGFAEMGHNAVYFKEITDFLPIWARRSQLGFLLTTRECFF
jgi:hypothetical protein